MRATKLSNADHFSFGCARRHRQRGAVALFISLMILVLITAIAIAAAQIAVGEQRNTANEVRAREALAVAEAGLERGVAYLEQNRRLARSTAAGGWMQTGAALWSVCSGSTTTVPCGNGTSNLFDNNWTAYANVANLAPSGENLTGAFAVHYVARNLSAGSSTPGEGVYYVVAQGQSEDGVGRSLIRRGTVFYPTIAHRPDAPLVAAGTIATTGALSVVANPNGGGTGVPLSAWAENDLSIGGNMKTCHLQEYLSTNGSYTYSTDFDGNTVTRCPACECPGASTDQLSNTGIENIDILDDDGDNGVNPDQTNFPDDVFEYVFGIPWADYQKKKDEATIITSAAALGPTSAGLYWSENEINIPSNTVVGSVAEPVILVVENNTVRMNANSEFFGIIFAFANPPSTGTVSVLINGGPTLYGSIISNKNIDLGNGNYTARYDRTVLDNLSSGGASAGNSLTMVPGSWTDY
ncbi:MAG: hypothetical protein HYV18_06295 [Gammaproteobacteria bacterium]|nr:hypothetical protein [Gammaproteobacteria bacterium]